MVRNKSAKTTRRWQYALACMAIILVFLSSCHFKSGIKGILGLPLTTQQTNAPKNNPLNFANIGTCVYGELSATKISHMVAPHAGQVLQFVLISAIFASIFGFLLAAAKPHLRYESVKVSGSLPLFLQQQKLVI
ncbi:MAG: hypothetical protein ACOH2A_11405 [Sphingobacteriaceae bacterium]